MKILLVQGKLAVLPRGKNFTAILWLHTLLPEYNEENSLIFVSSGHPDDSAGWQQDSHHYLFFIFIIYSVSKRVFYVTDFSVECNSKLEKLLRATYR